ncbi:SulP family inorganic anion transporter [Legionella oakridgensis]|uniref:Sulfate permease-related transporter n=2 Tax=Legionella oakridgensis TaxID=29423 RepID=W0BI11_9GAMM|nr:SulP family inorganic anion transporter [Legionella oakridgensis]AHE68321.1 sulfate permease-related transporter [Legionella oakridgensis ATCC 33761 = DSM 21215]ETO92238.1 sulfate permease [Legionella oakridgensis RV-2-2007]KTD39005.1 sulfate transporter [Legionella oakridgensis]STY21267.1 sulfate permease [Legionella longbeachae]
MQPVQAYLLQWRAVLKRLFPCLEWLPELRQWITLRADLLAGFTVAMLFIPQSMAYAHLAGLPVYMGLYAAFLPPIIAAIFGSSRILSTGPVPVTSLLTAVAMQSLAATGTTEYIQYVLLLTFMAGAIQLVLGFLRFGVVVNFISYPVILGFINAVAIIIASMQIGNLFGVYTVTAPHSYQMVWQVLSDAWGNTHWPTVGIAALAFIIILGGRWLSPNLPSTLIAVVVTTIIAWLSGYEKLTSIRAEQIINLPVQQMLANHQRYPEDVHQVLKEVAKTKAVVEKTIKKAGLSSQETEEALNNAAQAKWQLERLITRHNFEIGELNRLHLRRLVTHDHQEVFFVDEQMTPIGEVDPYEWRIASLPLNGKLTLQAGGEVVGNIPRGLPAFKTIRFGWDAMSSLFMGAFVIALVGFTEAITIAKRIATENRQRLNTNQELLGQGLAKCIGSFFQSMPVSGGFTRSAINFQAGAKTGFSSIVAGLIVMVVLLWLTPFFYYLPYATLAVVIMVGVLGLLDIKEMWNVWKVSRKEGIVVLLTFLLTLLLAPRLAYAVLLGMLLSLGFYLYETMRPRFSELTRNEEGDIVEVSEGDTNDTCYLISLVRLNGSLYFANAAYFEEKILKLISAKQKLRYIILDCVSINQLDATGLEVLRSICSRLEEGGLELWFTRVRRPVLNVLKRGGLFAQLGEHHFYKNNEEALAKLAGHLGAKHMNTCPLAVRK